nr:hypothetical protein [Heyndrickxia oleronia]
MLIYRGKKEVRLRMFREATHLTLIAALKLIFFHKKKSSNEYSLEAFLTILP